MNKLESMGFTVFNDVDRRCRDLEKYGYPLIYISWPFQNASPVYLDIDPVNAEAVIAKIGSMVIVGIDDNYRIAISKGEARKLSRYSNGRRRLNLNMFREQLKALTLRGTNRTEIKYRMEFTKDETAAIFTPEEVRHNYKYMPFSEYLSMCKEEQERYADSRTALEIAIGSLKGVV